MPPLVVLCKRNCPKADQKWYDADCRAARARLRHTLRGTSEYVALRKAYKSLMRRKQRAHQRMAEQDLCMLADRNPRAFWESYQERQAQHNNISRPAWEESFQTLYRAPAEGHAAQQTISEATMVNPIQPQCPLPMPASHPASASPTSNPLNADITMKKLRLH